MTARGSASGRLEPGGDPVGLVSSSRASSRATGGASRTPLIPRSVSRRTARASARPVALGPELPQAQGGGAPDGRVRVDHPPDHGPVGLAPAALGVCVAQSRREGCRTVSVRDACPSSLGNLPPLYAGYGYQSNENGGILESWQTIPPVTPLRARCDSCRSSSTPATWSPVTTGWRRRKGSPHGCTSRPYRVPPGRFRPADVSSRRRSCARRCGRCCGPIRAAAPDPPPPRWSTARPSAPPCG